MGNQMLDTATERRPFVLVVEGVPYIVGHKDYEASSCEKLLPRPVRDERFVTLADAASFAEYIKLHGQKNSAVYVSATWPASNKPLAEVVIDDGAAGESSWRDHRATLSPVLTKTFSDWRMIDQEKISQLNLCVFLDRHLSGHRPAGRNVRTIGCRGDDLRVNALRHPEGGVQKKRESGQRPRPAHLQRGRCRHAEPDDSPRVLHPGEAPGRPRLDVSAQGRNALPDRRLREAHLHAGAPRH